MKNKEKLRILESKLDEILEILRSSSHYPAPTFPTIPVFPAPETVCSLCGMDFSGITGYACANAGCPMGLGPIICKV